MALTNIQAYYKLNGNSTDATGTGHDGVDTAMSYSAAVINNGASFGSTSNIVCPALSTGGSSVLTLSFWFKKTAAKLAVPLAQYNPVPSGHQWFTSVNTSNLFSFGVSSDGNADPFGTTTNAISLGVWTHVFCVFNGTATGNSNRLKIYINGVQQTLTFSGTVGTGVFAINDSLYIGALRGNQATHYFDGMLDEIGIWRDVGTAQDALDYFANGGGWAHPFIKRPNFEQFFF